MLELNAEEKESIPFGLKPSHAQKKKDLANYCASPSKHAFVSTGRLAGRYENTQIALLYALR